MLKEENIKLLFPALAIAFIFAATATYADNSGGSGWEFSTEHMSDPYAGGASGQFGQTSNRTGEGNQAMPHQSTPGFTSPQSASQNSNIPYSRGPVTTTPTLFSQLDRTFGGTLPSALPKTQLDSFVKQAGGHAEKIYGDEGAMGPPPSSSFDTINSGVHSGGLTTGVRYPNLPSAWGRPN